MSRASLARGWKAMQDGIRGWVKPEMLDILLKLDAAQASRGVHGDLGEIGVHHGKLLVAFCHLAKDAERVVGFDCFEDQQFNLDNSGRGDREKVLENIARFGTGPGPFLVKCDSLTLDSDEYPRFRLFSVDGCHSLQHTLSDLRFAAGVLAEGGVIMVDDYPHPGWPNVKLGTDQFLAADPGLASFLCAANKLFLSQRNWCASYARVVA